MTTSTVTTYQLTRNELLTAGIRKLGVLARGQVPDAEDLENGAQALNTLVAYLRSKGLPLWARKEYIMSLTADTSSYTIGTGQTIATPYPLKMIEAYSIPTNGNSRIPITIVSNQEYNILPTGSSSGQPIQLSYQPNINYGTIKIWPTPDSTVVSAYTVKLVYQRPFEYFSTANDTMDFPEEWYLPIIYKLAVLLAPEWGIPLEDRRELKAEAKEYLEMIDSFGEEDASFFMQPDRRY